MSYYGHGKQNALIGDAERKRLAFHNESMSDFRKACQRLHAAGYTARGLPRVSRKGVKRAAPRKRLPRALGDGPVPVIGYRSGVTAMGGMREVQVRTP